MDRMGEGPAHIPEQNSREGISRKPLHTGLEV